MRAGFASRRAAAAALAALVSAFASAPPRALAYGREGHQAIAELARGMLEPQARQAIRRILGSDDLAAVASWADELKQARRHQGELANDPEARAFNASFPDNGKWHFVDLPLGTIAYSDHGKFSSEHDIVHEINECIAILEASPNHATRFDRRQALRLLVHLVGDVHQPLHVGTGYYDLSGPVPVLIEDPGKAVGRPDDEGGNELRFGESRFSELHAYWDEALVEHVAHTKDFRKLARVLKGRIRSRGGPGAWETPGDYHRWAEQWATDSVHQARAAYRGIVFLSAETGRSGKLKLIRIRLPARYERDQLARVADELAKGGFHLASLLNRIQWR